MYLLLSFVETMCIHLIMALRKKVNTMIDLENF